MNCTICLEELRNPTALPCGHIYCERCIIAHVRAGRQPFQALCPTCRKSFVTVNADLKFIDEKLHPFIAPSLRRVYLDNPTRDAELTRLRSLVALLEHDKELLMSQCENNQAAAEALSRAERKARRESDRLKEQVNALKEELVSTKDQYSALQRDNMPSQPRPSLVYEPHAAAHPQPTLHAAAQGLPSANASSSSAAHLRVVSNGGSQGSKCLLTVQIGQKRRRYLVDGNDDVYEERE